MTQETLKKMYQLLLTEPHAPTVCFELEAIAREALAQPPLPVQEPVAWVCYGAPGKRDIDFEEADINGLPIGTSLYTAPPLPVQPEPLEYWNAVEGWVKIDEVREHFDAVNCGTIYKNGGEGRVPLYTAPPQQKAEPVAWDKPSDNFNAWWDSYRHDGGNPFQTDSFAYWAFAGWKAALAQRPWVGLEAEDLAQIESDEFWQVGNHMAIAMAVEAKLKEKNT